MRVRAVETVFYAGRDRLVGEEFETEDDMHGKVLMIAGKVAAVEDEKVEKRGGRYRRRDMRADK